MLPSPLMSGRVTKSMPPARPRSRLKCKYCRIKKCKCNPKDRDWENSRQRCQQCMKGGQECGPNVLKPAERESPDHASSDPSLATIVDYVPSHTDGVAFENEIFIPELQQAGPILNVQNTVGPTASSIAENDFSSPTHAATSDSQIVSLGIPKYSRYGPLPEKAMILEHQSVQFEQDFTNAIHVGTFNLMYDDQLGSASNGNTRAQIGLQPEIDSQSLTKLKLMGMLQILHTYFQDLEWGLPLNFCSHDSIDLCQQRRFSLNVVTAVIKSNFRQTLTALFGELQETPPMFKESILRRAAKIIERFERPPVRRESIERSDSVAAKIQSTLLRELIDAAGAQDDAVEVAHLQEELSALISPDDNDMQDALAGSFVKLSRLASGVLQNLAISESDLAALGLTNELALPTVHRAMHAGFEKIAVKLLSNCVEPDCRLPDVLGRRTIHIAVETRCLQILRCFLEQNPKACDWRDSLQRTPLLIAASKGELAAFGILLEKGADIAARDLSNRTSLNYACSQGNVPIVEKLLVKGADVNDRTLNNLAALPEAATYGHYGVCMVLLISQQCVNQMVTAAKCAAANGHNRVAELIRSFVSMMNMKQYFSCLQEQASHRLQDEDGKGQNHLGEDIEFNSWVPIQQLNTNLFRSFDFPEELSCQLNLGPGP